jgi:hypothetical protein
MSGPLPAWKPTMISIGRSSGHATMARPAQPQASNVQASPTIDPVENQRIMRRLLVS